jgi:hypothetical protein
VGRSGTFSSIYISFLHSASAKKTKYRQKAKAQRSPQGKQRLKM